MNSDEASIDNTIRTRPSILVANYNQYNPSPAAGVLDEAGYRIIQSYGAEQAMDCLLKGRVDILITDLTLGTNEQIELLHRAKSVNSDLQAIIVARKTAGDCLSNEPEGDYQLLEEPINPEQLLRAVQRIVEAQSVHREQGVVRINLNKWTGDERLIYRSDAMRKIARMVEHAAPSSATVLLEGESGTGKEVLADVLHAASPRAGGPFIKVNCAALPETLVEAELFGYEKGAFTGAHVRKQGRFEMANGGTLFLDEIGDLSPAVQVKLLRVLQNRSFERVGGTQTIRTDLRLIAATNKHLESEIKANRFREDLFYRLNVINITVPPLRERRNDVELLAAHFVRVYADKNNKEVTGIAEDAMRILLSYDWPGNVRELENAIERAVIFTTCPLVTVAALPSHISPMWATQPPFTFTIGSSLRDIESRAIELTLHHTRGNKQMAARILGIAARTISRHLKRQRQKVSGFAALEATRHFMVEEDANFLEDSQAAAVTRHGSRAHPPYGRMLRGKKVSVGMPSRDQG